jgi:hypothetical protein
MIRFIGSFAFLSGVLLVPLPGRGDDDLSAFLQKMVDAKGGPKLAKVEAYRLELRSTLLSGDNKIRVSGSSAVRGFDCSRLEIRTDKIRHINVFNKGHGWVREDGKTRDMTREEIAEARESAYMGWVAMTLPITEPGITFKRLPAIKEESGTLLGVRISKKGMPDLELWVDANTYLPVRQKFQFQRPDGKVVTMEMRMGEHKKYNDIVITTKSTTYRNGEKWLETEVVEAQFYTDGNKLDFSKP